MQFQVAIGRISTTKSFKFRTDISNKKKILTETDWSSEIPFFPWKRLRKHISKFRLQFWTGEYISWECSWLGNLCSCLCWPLNASHVEAKIPVNVWAILYFGWTVFFGQTNGFTMTNYGHGNATRDHERKVTPNLGLPGRISFQKLCFKSFKEIFSNCENWLSKIFQKCLCCGYYKLDWPQTWRRGSF